MRPPETTKGTAAHVVSIFWLERLIIAYDIYDYENSDNSPLFVSNFFETLYSSFGAKW